jgi:SAM-dependent methyltransferase
VWYAVPSEASHPSDGHVDSFVVACKNALKRVPGVYRALIAIFGASSGGLAPAAYLRRHVPTDGVVLNLGSGSGTRYGGAIHVDLFPFPGVDLVADITHLPVRDASVDAIICLATLEHVPHPAEVVREIGRVLKPGGTCYLTTPFLQPYHSSPHDYRRWTLDGLRVLFQEFSCVDAGVRHGPTSALLLMLAYWIALLLSFGFRRLFDLLLVVWMILLMPVAHPFDFILMRMRIAETLASGYFYVARKPMSSPHASH